MTEYIPSYQLRIPSASYYVVSHDTFMSGWGAAEGRVNACVVPALDYDEAIAIASYVSSRGDQRYVSICSARPRPRGRLLSLVLAWRTRAGLAAWKGE